jgi:hypothetical protein
MLTLSLKRPNFFNQKLHDYCLKSTNESIKKKIMNCDEERKINKNTSFVLQDSFPSEPNNNNIIAVVCFLSVSSFLYYFYNSKR